MEILKFKATSRFNMQNKFGFQNYQVLPFIHKFIQYKSLYAYPLVVERAEGKCLTTWYRPDNRLVILRISCVL